MRWEQMGHVPNFKLFRVALDVSGKCNEDRYDQEDRITKELKRAKNLQWLLRALSEVHICS